MCATDRQQTKQNMTIPNNETGTSGHTTQPYPTGTTALPTEVAAVDNAMQPSP